MVDIHTANKGQLRQLARESGLSYDGLNVEALRAALLALPAPETAPAEEAAPVGTVDAETAEVTALVEAGIAPEPLPIVEPAVEQAPVVVAPAVPVAPPVPAVSTRPEQNGVKRPAAGTLCGQIWNYCDVQFAAGIMPKAKELRAWGAGRLDDTTMTVQFYRWRKFQGIGGRQA